MILRLLARLSVPALVALLALPASGARADIFTVTDVHLDATADSVTAAREQAMAEGQVRAVERLWERLVAPEARPQIPPLSAAELSDYYVQNLRVSGEQTSTNRYIADLTVRFRGDQIREFLRSHGVPYTETRSRPVLVLPLWGEPGAATLWDGDNPWLVAWQQLDFENDLVPLVAPLGDLADLTGVDSARASAGDLDALATMADRYGAGDVLVSRAALAGDPASGGARVEVVTERYPDARGPAQTGSDSVAQEPGEDLAGLLARAADRISAGLQRDWLTQNQLRYDQQSQLQAMVPVGSLDELVEVQRRLGQVAAVRDHYTLSVTRSAAEIGLVYYGDPMRLQRALSQVELALDQLGQPAPGRPAWQLRLTRSAMDIDSAPLGGDGRLETLPQSQQPAPEEDAAAQTQAPASDVQPLVDGSGRPARVPAAPAAE